jgi:ubiquitin carboxyl-terminal hydrolase 1
MIPSLPISSPTASVPSRSSTPTSTLHTRQRDFYRLSAVVCHYGQHSFGHYVAYRRKPRPETAGAARWAPPRLSCPLGCRCEKCALYGEIRDDFALSSRRGGGWLRISDAAVEEVGIETVLAEQSGTFMLYYERILPPPPPLPVPYAESVMTRSSEETVVATPTLTSTTRNTTPAHTLERRKRTHSMANNENDVKNEVRLKAERLPSPNPRPDLHFPRVDGVAARIVRSTSVGVRSGSQGSRSRSLSVAPPPPPLRVANGVSVVNGHAAAAAGTIVQGPPHPNGMTANGPSTTRVQSLTKKKMKQSASMGDVNINGAPQRTLVGSDRASPQF